MFARYSLPLFAGKVALFIIVLAVAWSLLVTQYNYILAGAAEIVDPSGVSFAGEGSSILVEFDEEFQRVILEVEGLSFQYGLVILLALILATPKLGIRRRLKFIGLAMLIMFILHVIAMLVTGQMARAVTPQHPTVAGRPAYVFFISMGVDLFPVVIGVALLFRYWIRGFRKDPSPKTSEEAHGNTGESMMARIAG